MPINFGNLSKQEEVEWQQIKETLPFTEKKNWQTREIVQTSRHD